MINRKIVCAACASAAALSGLCITTSVRAESCNGYVAFRNEPPILLKKTAAGASIYWFTSQRTNIVVHPENSPSNRTTGVCSGGWTIAADGKTGAGAGFCTNVTPNGDVFHQTYEGTFAGGTWKVVGGTGKFANYKGNGTWEGVGIYTFDNMWRSHTWKGECNFPK